jgi:hypothetical protein
MFFSKYICAPFGTSPYTTLSVGHRPPRCEPGTGYSHRKRSHRALAIYNNLLSRALYGSRSQERRALNARLLGLRCSNARPLCGALAESCSPDFDQFFSCRDFGVQHILTSENQHRRHAGVGIKRSAREQLGRKTGCSFVPIQRSSGSFSRPSVNSSHPATDSKYCDGSRSSPVTTLATETAVSCCPPI